MSNGSTAAVDAVAEPPLRQQATIPADGFTVARLVNTYTAPRGSLRIDKQLTGMFTIPADPASPTSMVLDDLDPGDENVNPDWPHRAHLFWPHL